MRYAIVVSLLAGFFAPSYVFAQQFVDPAIQQDIVSEPAPAIEPITGYERLEWFTNSSIGPASLLGGTFSAGWGTLFDTPHEYGTHLEGFGERYGMRMTGIVTQNAMEAGLGAAWGEDPRYHRAVAGTSVGGRIGHIVKWTFVAPDRDGNLRPAYARYIAIISTNFLSNAWREPSEANDAHAVERIGLGFLGRMAGNAWDEFWPDARKKFFHHSSQD